MAKLDKEQAEQFRLIVREEIAIQLEVKLEQKLQPMNEKLDQIRTTQIEDSNALAAAHVKLSDTVGGHERRIKKLERARV